MNQLVESKEGETLLSENASLEDIEKHIQKLQPGESAVEEDGKRPQEEENFEPQKEEDPSEEVGDENVEEEAPASLEKKEEDDRIKKEDLIALLREQLQQKQNTPSKPQEDPKELTVEQKLEMLANDPDSYIESRIRPYREQLEQLENQRAWELARTYNKDFARLEKSVQKLMRAQPNLVRGKNPLETLEGYYLMAKAMEVQGSERDRLEKEETEKAKRLSEKKSASAMPKATRKVSASGSVKSFGEMSLDELESEIKRLGKG